MDWERHYHSSIYFIRYNSNTLYIIITVLLKPPYVTIRPWRRTHQYQRDQWVANPQSLLARSLFINYDSIIILRYKWHHSHICGSQCEWSWWSDLFGSRVLMTSSNGYIFRVNYWSFERGIHPSPVDSPHKGQWRGALMFSLLCARTNGWANNWDACDLRRHCAHFDVTVMMCILYNDIGRSVRIKGALTLWWHDRLQTNSFNIANMFTWQICHDNAFRILRSMMDSPHKWPIMPRF